jgi:glycosyltransferase involved in cell wall biosynthesis
LYNFYKKEYNFKNLYEILPSASSIKNISFKCSKKIAKKEKKLNVGYFGSMHKTRGLNFIINLARIDKANNYYLFGFNKNIGKIYRRKFQINNIFFLDYVYPADVSKKINIMDICIVPYEKERVVASGGFGNIVNYTSPLKLFDYLAMGKLIMVSDIPVLHEVLKNKQNCLFMNNLNPYSWKMKILFIKNNFEKNIIMSQNAFKSSIKYTYINRCKKILDCQIF